MKGTITNTLKNFRLDQESNPDLCNDVVNILFLLITLFLGRGSSRKYKSSKNNSSLSVSKCILIMGFNSQIYKVEKYTNLDLLVRTGH